ncbi:uncharacterized protein LOC117172042 [Belonocnema kinseyi]|uniref:uncharacterized protein LOC117172042 n=1 Tax=Belonocnema kinseyi TaxID=2817044 RepID=UPI00143D94BF|nr:uncharacterized protein LOC117172042 [Belonocnema kinseyi]
MKILILNLFILLMTYLDSVQLSTQSSGSSSSSGTISSGQRVHPPIVTLDEAKAMEDGRIVLVAGMRGFKIVESGQPRDLDEQEKIQLALINKRNTTCREDQFYIPLFKPSKGSKLMRYNPRTHEFEHVGKVDRRGNIRAHDNSLMEARNNDRLHNNNDQIIAIRLYDKWRKNTLV